MIKENIGKALYKIGGKVINAYSKIMLDMDIKRFNNVPRGAKIIVANHPTTCDPFILTSFSNGQAAVLIKDILFDVPVFGKYLHLAGHIPVRKNEGKEAFTKALETLNKGITVIIFIEGDLSKFIHKVNKPKTGAVRLAMLSGKPIIPIGISVKDKNIKPITSTVKGMREMGKWYFKGPYAITFGKPICFTGDSKNRERVQQLSNWLRNNISRLENEGAKRLNRKRK